MGTSQLLMVQSESFFQAKVCTDFSIAMLGEWQHWCPFWL